MKKNSFMPAVVLGSICIVAALLLSVVNMITAPIIEKAQQDAASKALLEVLPNGKNFKEIEITDEYPSAVTAGYRADGGFVFQMTVAGYKPGLVIMCGIDTDGKIVGVKPIATNETYHHFEDQLNVAYVGTDLSSFKVIIATGATPTSETSRAYGEAISAALQAAAIASGGKVDPAIILESKIAEFAPNLVSPKAIDLPEGSEFSKILKAANDSGFVYLYSDGETGYMVIVNATGACVVYDMDGNDVTDAQTEFANKAKEHAAQNQKSYVPNLTAKVETLFADASDITPVEVNTFDTLVSALTFKVGDADYYAFYAKSVGYKQMDVYIVIDSNGAIAKFDVKQLFFDEEYFNDCPEIDKEEYKAGFDGLTTDTWTGDEAMIAGATKTSNAIKQATKDAFAAFESITAEGGNE